MCGIANILQEFRQQRIGLSRPPVNRDRADSSRPRPALTVPFTHAAQGPDAGDIQIRGHICECLFLALFGHGAMSDLSPLSGVKRKLDSGAVRAAFDPGCVKTCTSQECAALFSLSSSLSSGRKHFWFSNLRNRDGISTRRLNVGVFTRPRPNSDIRLLRPMSALGDTDYWCR